MLTEMLPYSLSFPYPTLNNIREFPSSKGVPHPFKEALDMEGIHHMMKNSFTTD